MPPSKCTVRMVIPVLISPLKSSIPMQPPYQRRAEFSNSSIFCMAAGLGAPVSVTAHRCESKASKPSQPSFSSPTTWSTV